MNRVTTIMNVGLCLLLAGCSTDDSDVSRDDDSSFAWTSGWETDSPEERIRGDQNATPFKASAPIRPVQGVPLSKPTKRRTRRNDEKSDRVVPVVPAVRNAVPTVHPAEDFPLLAVRAKRPSIVSPPRKRASGIDWHTTIQGGLTEAAANEKPVMCFRVLGDVSGFM